MYFGHEHNALRSDAAAASFLHVHQQLGALALGTTPTNGQTVTFDINGSNVVFKAVTGTPTSAGDVKAPGTAAGFVANLWAALINPTTSTTTFIALSSANAILVQYLGWGSASGGTTITPFSLNTSTYSPLTSFSASTTVTSGSWTGQAMQLYVEPGAFYIGLQNREIFLGGSTPTFTAPVSNPRIDLVVIGSTGTLSNVAGSENASPVAPTYPKGSIVLAEVYHVVGETAIYDNDNQQTGQGYVLNDVRPFLLNGLYVSQTGAEIYALDTGTTNAFAIALNPAITSYVDGQLIAFKAANANTGSCTLAVNGLSALTIYQNKNNALPAGAIVANQIVIVSYDSVAGAFQMQSQTATTSKSTQASFTVNNYESIALGAAVAIGDGNGIYTIDHQTTQNNSSPLSTSSGNNQFGQTFTTKSDTTKLVSLTVWMSSNNTAGTASVEAVIYATSGGVPTGGSLGAVSASVPSNSSAGAFVFTFGSPISLSASTQYAAVFKNTNNACLVTIYWQNSAVLTGGTMITTANAGSSWTVNASQTLYFIDTQIINDAGQLLNCNANGANSSRYNNFIGFAAQSASVGTNCTVNVGGIDNNQTSLTVGVEYYLANSNGGLSTSAGSNSRKVGLSLSTTTILIKLDNYP